MMPPRGRGATAGREQGLKLRYKHSSRLDPRSRGAQYGGTTFPIRSGLEAAESPQHRLETEDGDGKRVTLHAWDRSGRRMITSAALGSDLQPGLYQTGYYSAPRQFQDRECSKLVGRASANSGRGWHCGAYRVALSALTDVLRPSRSGRRNNEADSASPQNSS
ncbi:hypothetical protein BX600DRAFT_521072 [Xylariales sp. PMI_506]|nr:hypothetical protein BX600DRAFT_521072 [Xylariales sp. PMI_506]